MGIKTNLLGEGMIKFSNELLSSNFMFIPNNFNPEQVDKPMVNSFRKRKKEMVLPK